MHELTPAMLREMTIEDLEGQAAWIRAFLVEKVSASGGHLGPNLGVVELTLALHRVFDSPHDRLVWDTGHQSYVHKIVTGRAAGFDALRRRGGLSGYPSAAESEHDVVENSHASTALSYANGLARADAARGRHDRRVVAVVGDGALTGGMAWEGLNNVGGAGLPTVVVLNDNGRSYAPTAGSVATHLAGLRAGEGPSVFAALGLEYLGPVDGHDLQALCDVLARARLREAPVLVHVVTSKGRGFVHTENDDLDRGHAVRPMDPVTGAALAAPSGPSFTSVFSDALVRIAARRPDVVGVTAAMAEPAGLLAMGRRWPDRVVDVGIAEQHALTMAAGLCLGGMRPVVAIYSTFATRAVDQLLLDVALHRLPVTLVLDRAGVTGDDGPSHNGVWDLSLLQMVPGLRIGAPRDATRLRELLDEAVDRDDGPTAIRFPKGPAGVDVPVGTRFAGLDVLLREGPLDVLFVAVGVMAVPVLQAAALLRARGIGVTVVDPRWVSPLPSSVTDVARRHRLAVTVEDGVVTGGIGTAVAAAMAAARVSTPARAVGVPATFPDHGSRDRVLSDCGLTAPAIARTAIDELAAIDEPVPIDELTVADEAGTGAAPPSRDVTHVGEDR